MKTELQEIFQHLRNVIDAHRDIGLDPPPITAKGRNRSCPQTRPLEVVALEDPAQPEEPLQALLASIQDCKRCKLARGRTQMVFGEGPPRARVVFIGEAPGREEDLAGRPFVGEAGRLLTRIIENGMGISRDEVYICNVVKCRPPENRDPEPDEIEQCLPFLKQQIQAIQPEVLCALGRVATQAMLGNAAKFSTQRGNWFSFMNIPLMPTFHPAYLLRNLSAKREVWDDIQKVMKRLGLEVKK